MASFTSRRRPESDVADDLDAVIGLDAQLLTTLRWL